MKQKEADQVSILATRCRSYFPQEKVYYSGKIQ